MDRITRQNVEDRVENVNRRLARPGVHKRVQVQGRNGYIGLEEVNENGDVVRVLRTGTKRDIADFLHAMMVGIDLSRNA